MALHKVKIRHLDGTAATFFENPDGTWEYCLNNGITPNWFNSISTQMMIASVCAASDLGAEIKIEKSEDKFLPMLNGWMQQTLPLTGCMTV